MRDDADDGLEAFYAGSYQRLVSVVGAVAQDRHEAEEAVQDAFARLLGQWPRVSRYDCEDEFVTSSRGLTRVTTGPGALCLICRSRLEVTLRSSDRRGLSQ